MKANEKFQRATSRAGMRTTTITMPVAMHERLSIEAVKANMALTALVRLALQDWLRSRGKSGSR